MSNPQTEPVRLSKRTCRYCQRDYRAPAGSKPHACPECAPTLYDALQAVEAPRMVESAFTPPNDGIPF